MVAFLLRINLIIPLFLLLLAAYIKMRGIRLGRRTQLYLLFLFVVNLFVCYVLIVHRFPAYYLPFAAISMIACIIFGNLEVAFSLAIACSVTAASFTGNNLYLGVLYALSGILGSMLVFGARRRMTIIRAGFIIGLAQGASFYFIKGPSVFLTMEFFYFFLNGLGYSLIVVGCLRIFEYLFDSMTNFSLLELADFNHPLLQRMTLEAPGTYHHSLIVGNLADAACRVVGANALLARIGSYYHDIGKLTKPHYFSENQDISASRHDALSPTMSKLVIMNHVKDGVELAQKYRFHGSIIDFIQQHHGTSLVYYFYRRAIENLDDNDQPVEEEVFRYPGPKPSTRETAIVLLADSVEAATRSLKEPDPAKISEVVHKIINNKFIDGQLDECDVTLKNLERIAAVFIRILSGIYHNRVTYPESESGNSHKKSAKENSRQSEKDKSSSS